MNIEEAFRLVANLDFKESHRRYAPQYGLLQFNSTGEVVGFSRFKDYPDEIVQYQTLTSHPGCLQIFTVPTRFKTAEDLQRRINEDLWLFSCKEP